ncbi:HAMP domain-containing protein [Candidatus Electrothrix aarhusensis]|uniref:histidine kinase n=1 Tax=Candidatus Electrothrix aarhusensis TaxID=1859131 RepID=A0A3S3U8E0_9BACT|nr:HAMP domain-containing protein [Candidatus Electrothrix aarhusensis]
MIKKVDKVFRKRFLPKSGLQRQLIFYIVFIGVVFLTMAVEMNGFLRGEKILGTLNGLVSPDISAELVEHILLKVRVMLGNLLLAIGLVMMLFTKRIMFPLELIIEGTRAMSAGDFSTTLPEQSKDELGELARHINELNANEQELILLTKGMADQIRQTLIEGEDATKIAEAVEIIDELEEALAEFGRSFYQC